MNQDRIYANQLDHIVDFRFDETVAGVFPDMLRRSVPGYSTIIALTGILAGRYAQPDSKLYDLGCSLGACTMSMRNQVREAGVQIVSVDNSEAMTRRAGELLAQEDSAIPVELRTEDIRETAIDNASVVVMNLTLQFVPMEERIDLLRRIRSGMRPGGVLLLTEKMHLTDLPGDDLQESFKLANGYSQLEISQKRTALEHVLIPETPQAHVLRLREAGFCDPARWFQCLQFVSILAFAD